jgi:hypothetical protein
VDEELKWRSNHNGERPRFGIDSKQASSPPTSPRATQTQQPNKSTAPSRQGTAELVALAPAAKPEVAGVLVGTDRLSESPEPVRMTSVDVVLTTDERPAAVSLDSTAPPPPPAAN